MNETVIVSGPRVGQVLLAALLQVGDRLVELQLAELDGEIAGVVLDRRHVVDRLAQATLLRVGEPFEGPALDVNQIGDIKNLVQTREVPARPGGVTSCQDGDSSGGREGGRDRADESDSGPAEGPGNSHQARPAKIAHGTAALCRTVQLSRTPPAKAAYVARTSSHVGGYGYWLTGAV